jgi:hypothetical protein
MLVADGGDCRCLHYNSNVMLNVVLSATSIGIFHSIPCMMVGDIV